MTNRRGRRNLTLYQNPDRVLTEIFGVIGRLSPPRVSAPVDMAGAHVRTIAHPKQQGPLRSVDVFVQFAGGMHHEGARRYVDDAVRRAHLAAALKTEIDLGGFRVTMIGAHLTRLPAGNRDIAFRDPAEDFLDVLLRVE